MSNINQLVNEMIGHGMSNKSQTEFSHLERVPEEDPNVNPNDPVKLNVREAPIKLPPMSRLTPRPWQSQLVAHVFKGEAVFVNVSPAGGKSLPIELAFEQMLFSATSWKDVPKLIWVCETKTLASQIYFGFRNFLYLKIAEVINGIDAQGNTTVSGALPHFMIKHINISHARRDKRSAQEEVKALVDNWTSLMIGTQDKRPPTDPRAPIEQQTLIIATSYVYAIKLIEIHKPALVVIDEIQERFPTGGSSNDSDKRVGYLYNTLKATPKTASIAVLTGSMHPSTSQGIADVLGKHIKRKFKVISEVDAKNRSSVGVYPLLLDRKNLVDAGVEIVKARSTNNLITLFNQLKITEFSKQLMQRLPKRDPKALFNKGFVSTPYRSPHAAPEPVKLNYSRGEIADLQREKEVSDQVMYKWWYKMGDPILKECLLHGFGYIMAGGKERDFYNKDVKVVEQLFKSGKIYFLLATTAVGVGVNLAVRNIYIPSIMMYSNGGYGKMDTSTLVQLINRAGRGASNITVANIFCHPDDVVWVTTLINSGDPSQHVDAIPFKDKKDPDSIINIFKRGKGNIIQNQIAAEFIQRGTINKSSKTEPRTRIVY